MEESPMSVRGLEGRFSIASEICFKCSPRGSNTSCAAKQVVSVGTTIGFGGLGGRALK